MPDASFFLSIVFVHPKVEMFAFATFSLFVVGIYLPENVISWNLQRKRRHIFLIAQFNFFYGGRVVCIIVDSRKNYSVSFHSHLQGLLSMPNDTKIACISSHDTCESLQITANHSFVSMYRIHTMDTCDLQPSWFKSYVFVVMFLTFH